MKSSCNPQLLQHLLDVRKDSLPNSKLVLSENGRGVSDFRLTLYKRSVDSRLRVEHRTSSCISLESSFCMVISHERAWGLLRVPSFLQIRKCHIPYCIGTRQLTTPDFNIDAQQPNYILQKLTVS
ncbi:hypothetical protein TNCV_2430771 [Trichonephila clavipes]|nr:hypothetical protein TNCV_2430771 [Trichonephila clavipes]